MNNLSTKFSTLFIIFLMVFINCISAGLIIPGFAPMLLGNHTNGLTQKIISVNVRYWYYIAVVNFPVSFMLVGALIWGYISDLIGRKKSLIFALIGTEISFVISIIGIINHIIHLVLMGQIILGLVNCNEAIAHTIITDMSTSSSNKKTFNISLITLGCNLGFAIGTLIGGYLVDQSIYVRFTYTTPFYCSIILTLLNIIFVKIFYQDKYSKSFSKISNCKIFKKNWIKDFFFIFNNKNIIVLLGITFCSELIWSLYFNVMPLFLINKFNYSIHIIGTFLMIMSITLAFTLFFLVYPLVRLFPKKIIIFCSFILLLFGGCILTFFPYTIFAWFSIIPMALGVGLTYSISLSLLSDNVSNKRYGKIIGIALAVVALSFTCSGLLIGVLSNINLDYIFIIIICTSILGGIYTIKY